MGCMPTSPARTVRQRVRAEMTDEIKAVARRHLAEHGAAALSLRAVAREVGLVSSAVYRYFASRDELLTALIVDAYDALGVAAEATEATEATGGARRSRSGAGVTERWMAVTRAVRDWARGHRHEYDLIYGSPVPGYAAPADTVAPATRVNLVLLRILADGVASGEIALDVAGAAAPVRIPRAVRADLATLRSTTGLDIPDPALLRGLAVWAQLYGALDLELHGHLHNVINDLGAFFELQMAQAARFLRNGA